MAQQRIYALLTSQGTACTETALFESEYTVANRSKVEIMAANDSRPDKPIPGTWTDVTDNGAFREPNPNQNPNDIRLENPPSEA